MKGYAKPLNEFICGQQIQFVIPVYQRNYDWLQDNCDQLLSDLIKLSHSGRKSHFFRFYRNISSRNRLQSSCNRWATAFDNNISPASCRNKSRQ